MAADPKLIPYGSGAWLITDVDDPARWAQRIRQRIAEGRISGLVDVVPAAETVLLNFASPADAASGVAAVETLMESAIGEPASRLDPADSGISAQRVTDKAVSPSPVITVAVRYDGEDLDAVARTCGLSRDEVITAHSDRIYEAAFCGFSPGFAYLRGLPPALQLPRRDTPRIRVPAGSVAIADRYAAVYPRMSPGGWHLLGHTEQVLFDPRRAAPALIQPGDRVRFEPQ